MIAPLARLHLADAKVQVVGLAGGAVIGGQVGLLLVPPFKSILTVSVILQYAHASGHKLWYGLAMTKQRIESVLERVRTWSTPLQEEAIEMLLAIEAMGDQPLVLSGEERRGVERGLDDVRSGRFASDDDMASLFARYKA